MSLCPCGSQQEYLSCCGLFIEQHQKPTTPEQLMRSRYTAYSLANISYIKSTMKGKPLIGYNDEAARLWAKKSIWLNLEIINSYMETPEQGFVEFCARFLEHNQLVLIHELSEFHFEHNSWWYVDGINKLPKENKHLKIGRNTPCPCGSGKKFKNCHFT